MNVPLSGTGATAGTLTPTPASLSFGNVQVNNTQTLPETLTNSGGSSVTITQERNSDVEGKSGGLTLRRNIGTGQSANFNVTFNPQSAGSVSGSLSVTSNASNSALNVQLSGTGITPGSLTANPASLSFGNVQVNNTQTLPETLTNSGGSSVTITQAAASNAAYGISGLILPITLGPGQSANFNVTFSPQAGGSASGKISVLSNASNPTLDISLSGNGLTPGVLAVTSSSLSFGSVAVNDSVSMTESLTNSGGTAVKVSQANVTGLGFS